MIKLFVNVKKQFLWNRAKVCFAAETSPSLGWFSVFAEKTSFETRNISPRFVLAAAALYNCDDKNVKSVQLLVFFCFNLLFFKPAWKYTLRKVCTLRTVFLCLEG